MGAKTWRMALRHSARCPGALLVASVLWLVQEADALGAGAKIPDPTNKYKEYGMNEFADLRLRYSMTVSIMVVRDKTYLGPKWNPELEAYELVGNFPNRTRDTLFELIDAGTMDNRPMNTRPRPADPYDASTQKFNLRFNETTMFRSEAVNKYIGVRGSMFNSEIYFVDTPDIAESFRLLPVFKWVAPHIMPTADNDNMLDAGTYVRNATSVHLLNKEQNLLNKIDKIDKPVVHGVGRASKGLWKDSDIFQFILYKRLEE